MYLIIHNPLSSNRKSKRKTKRIVRFFQKSKIPFVLRSTLKITNLLDYLETRKDITDIVFLGGDGSTNHLINTVDVNKIKANIHLAKSGSGNDFLRSLKPYKHTKATIGQAILNETQSVKFINGCGLGFDGLVCHYVNHDDKKSKISYYLNVFKAILKYKSREVTVTVDGQTKTYKKSYVAAIQNGKFFGGGMKVAPSANIDDDDYYIIIVHNISKFLLQFLLITIYVGWHRHIRNKVTILKGKAIEVSYEEPSFFQADGEVTPNVKKISVKAHSKRTFIAFNKKEIY